MGNKQKVRPNDPQPRPEVRRTGSGRSTTGTLDVANLLMEGDKVISPISFEETEIQETKRPPRRRGKRGQIVELPRKAYTVSQDPQIEDTLSKEPQEAAYHLARGLYVLLIWIVGGICNYLLKPLVKAALTIVWDFLKLCGRGVLSYSRPLGFIFCYVVIGLAAAAAGKVSYEVLMSQIFGGEISVIHPQILLVLDIVILGLAFDSFRYGKEIKALERSWGWWLMHTAGLIYLSWYGVDTMFAQGVQLLSVVTWFVFIVYTATKHLQEEQFAGY